MANRENFIVMDKHEISMSRKDFINHFGIHNLTGSLSSIHIIANYKWCLIVKLVINKF